MKTALLFDFSVDKEKKTISVKKEFAAELALVWTAWTTAEILDLWWGPKPYHVETKSMDFREGGTWLYAMVGPDGQKQWCRADYKKINPQKSFSTLDAFCDENGKETNQFPRSLWTNTFTSKGASTLVDIVLSYDKLEDLEKIVATGFQQGFTAGLGNLDQYIEAQIKLRTQLKTDSATRVCTYVNFPGNTEEAFMFYKSVFKTEFSGKGIQRFADIPASAEHPPLADAVKKMILHIELPILGSHVLMGTDAPKEMGFTVTPGNNMHISLEPESRAETKRIFDALSSGGNITMELQDMFFGAYYGSVTDKYGINWMVNFVQR